MFTSPNIAMHFKSAALRLDGKVPDQRRVADAQYVLSPLTEVQAQELGELIRDHLFTADDRPRAELTKSQFRHDGGLYRLTARLDPAIDPELVVDEVSVVKMTAQLEEQEDRAWITFTATLRLPFGHQSRPRVCDQPLRSSGASDVRAAARHVAQQRGPDAGGVADGRLERARRRHVELPEGVHERDTPGRRGAQRRGDV